MLIQGIDGGLLVRTDEGIVDTKTFQFVTE